METRIVDLKMKKRVDESSVAPSSADTGLRGLLSDVGIMVPSVLLATRVPLRQYALPGTLNSKALKLALVTAAIYLLIRQFISVFLRPSRDEKKRID